MSEDNTGQSPMDKAHVADRPALPKRFYKQARAAAAEGGYGIELDGRPLRTPGRKLLVVPDNALAEEIAAEWEAVSDVIDPAAMPLTRMANSALEGVADAMAAVAEDAAKFAEADLLCYRAEEPEGLVARQNAVWDPLIDWARSDLGARLNLAGGIVHVAQPEESLAAVRAHVAALDAFALTGVHVMTTLTGSIILALAVARGHLSAEEAWAASLVDEDWQISQWGADDEAMRRRAQKWLDMEAAARMTRRG